MTTAQKYTRLKGLTLVVSFYDTLRLESFHYSKDFSKRPDSTQRYEYLMEVLKNTGSNLMIIKPKFI